MTLGRTINILKVLGVAPLLASLFVSCDATIHEYPKSLKAEIVIKADIDHTGPYDYKEIDFDDEGKYTVKELPSRPSEVFNPDKGWRLRVTYEIRKRTQDGHTGDLVERRIKYTEKFGDETIDTIHTVLNDGNYIVAVFADYLSSNPEQAYNTDLISQIKSNYKTIFSNNYIKSCGAGRTPFSIDFNLSEDGFPNQAPGRGAKPGTLESRQVKVDVSHPVTRIKIVATDYDIFSKSVAGEVKIQTVLAYKQFVAIGFNAFSDMPNDFSKGYITRSQPLRVAPALNTRRGGEEKEKTIFMDYLFSNPAGEDSVMIDFDIVDSNGKTVNRIRNVSVPLKRNHETILKGMFLTKEYKGGDNGVSIDEGFDGEYIVNVGD